MDNFHWWAAKFPCRAITIDLTQPGPQPSTARGTREEARGGRRRRGGTEAWLNLNFFVVVVVLSQITSDPSAKPEGEAGSWTDSSCGLCK